ncbi:MAG: hypothetical protein HDR83_02910 [Bacteroides sp.]|nr:hypothetical protein [Bacteroidales bacterium]MBD5253570.1 hypothetical protein [Barnesiella sp.]MBD5368200.1 hypothetical protein [Bacteroides sp.]
MKIRPILAGAAVVLGLTMVSCDTATSLAKDVNGTWAGGVDRILGDALNSDVFSTYTFTYDAASAKAGGDIVINATLAGNYNDNVVVGETPSNVSVTVAGTSSISGTWTAIDDDEIVITLNPSTLKVSLDPAAQTLTSSAVLTAETIDTLKPSLLSMIKDRMAYDLRIKYSSPIHMDDVKVKGGKTLEYEVNDIDYTLTSE